MHHDKTSKRSYRMETKNGLLISSDTMLLVILKQRGGMVRIRGTKRTWRHVHSKGFLLAAPSAKTALTSDLWCLLLPSVVIQNTSLSFRFQ